MVLLISSLLSLSSCQEPTHRGIQTERPGVYPPPPQPARVVSLGNLRSGPAPTPAEVRLSIFLFGVEPASPLALVRPTDIDRDPLGLAICDGGLAGLLQWDRAAGTLAAPVLDQQPVQPTSISVTSEGHWLVCDSSSAAVLRYGTDRRVIARYSLPTPPSQRGSPELPTPPYQGESPDGAFRPAAALEVETEVWITNVARHCIEVFDAATGRHRRSIGRRGAGPLEFGMPLGMARCPGGEVCVADMLNCRVQVLGPNGGFIRFVGGPGDVTGHFGRPRDVSVGPDGTIFVVDAASQRVHAFDPAGVPLLAFGDSDDPIGGLSMPNGLCVRKDWDADDRLLPPGFVPAYFIFVAEQLLRPGIRVYAWGVETGDKKPETRKNELPSPSSAINPHWSATDCATCHRQEQGRIVPIAVKQVDDICLSCHDGVRARAEAHPVGRPGAAAGIQTPEGWPLVDGRLGCLTCHDILRHCDESARRPAINPAMLRHHKENTPPSPPLAGGEGAARPLDFCLQCHQPASPWRLSPHRQLDEQQRIKPQTCTFCHQRTPPVPSDGQRRGTPQLHADGSQLCLTCHVRHWDVSPQGHVERPVPEEMLDAMRLPSPSLPAKGGPGGGVNDVLPLVEQRVTCYTCHNPHQPGLFPPHGPLGRMAQPRASAAVSLRMDIVELCVACHPK